MTASRALTNGEATTTEPRATRRAAEMLPERGGRFRRASGWHFCLGLFLCESTIDDKIYNTAALFLVIPAQAGIYHSGKTHSCLLDPRLRGDDKVAQNDAVSTVMQSD